ncbi:hypothetical protein TIFTF001_022792 [Ficus carica]|uniref:DUF4220 domain-containing protein n=1 Tax=Ficus carica TaxID=3494 RepID=A0AA88AJ84_FICCA|nr:hypothetical protein TIFTF001_022792 [Ficus carica]
MENPIPKKVKKLWNAWNLRGSILLSLFLQALLVFFASSRQRRKSAFLLTLIWSAYLLADWVAAVAIGQITKSQGDLADHTKEEERLFAFWASFLLLHLGGPDSITAFALEDNEFWLRHLFGLILQVLAAFYSIYLALDHNKLLLPTLLVFLVGIVKYAERTRSLYLASLDRFGATALPKAEPGPDYEDVAAIYSSMRSVQVPTRAEMPALMPNYEEATRIYVAGGSLSRLDETELLREAYKLFQTFKGLIVGFFLSAGERKFSRNIFLNADYANAFRVIEYELGFMYQVLHTKVVVVRSKIGYFLRFVSFSFIFCAFVLFLLVDKHGFDEFEVHLTYALLVGAIVLDAMSVIRLVFSDWTLIVLKEKWDRFVPTAVLKRSKWSKLVFQYNMISYCLDERRIPVLFKFAEYIHAKEFLDKIKIMWFSTSEKVTENVEKFIFSELQLRAKEANSLRDAMEACGQRGDSALLRLKRTPIYIKLKWSIAEYQYAESLLIWHLATEICCHEEKSEVKDDGQRLISKLLSNGKKLATKLYHPKKYKSTIIGPHERKGQRICKILSDYMFYLLVMQPTMLSPVLGNWYIVFQDTSAEAQRYFAKHSIYSRSEAFKELGSVKPKYRPAAVKGVSSKSVFFDACILAKQLQNLEEKWKLMDQVWMELMSYAAINCRPIVHAQQPSKGGELLTFTWLLMNHLGLGMQFAEQEEPAGTKMVAVKY